MKPDYSLALAMIAAMPHPTPRAIGFEESPSYTRSPYQKRQGCGGYGKTKWSRKKWETSCKRKKIAKASKKRNRH